MEGRTQDEGSTTETTTIVGQDRTPEGALPQGTILEIQANLASKDLFASGCSWIERFGYDHAKLLNRPEILQSLLAHVEPDNEALPIACHALATLTLERDLRSAVCQTSADRTTIAACFAVSDANPGAAPFLAFAANLLSNQVNKSEFCKSTSIFKHLVRLLGSKHEEVFSRASACIVNLAVGRPAAMNKLAEAGIIPVAVRKLAQATDRSSVHRISLILAELAKSPEHEANIIQCARSAGALSRILAPASSGKSSATAAPENEPSTPEGLGTAAASEIGSTEEKVDVLTTGVPGVSASGDPQMIRAVMGAVYGELAEKPTKIVQPGQWQSSESGSLEADDTEEAAEEAMEEAT